jgi:hypothetical protein
MKLSRKRKLPTADFCFYKIKEDFIHSKESINLKFTNRKHVKADKYEVSKFIGTVKNSKNLSDKKKNLLEIMQQIYAIKESEKPYAKHLKDYEELREKMYKK